MSELIGQSLGRYHILEQLGEGGMAIVYKAYDTRLESEVAVKVIRTERLSPEILQKALKRFEREAKALAQLTHPNLVKVLDYGEYEGRPYLVMPYLPGGTLKQMLKGRPMDWSEAARLLTPVARALEYAHKRGLIHRDVKPSNILITESGEPMLTDFGIAKIIDEEATMDLTGTSAAIGTPEYMAPEQVTSKTVDQRADIYSLGIVFYEMVTGRRPYQADTPMAVLFKHASEPLPRPSLYASDLPEAVERILLKALSKKPEDRYQDMVGLAGALEGVLHGTRRSRERKPKEATAAESSRRSAAPGLPRMTNLLVGGVVAVALVGGGIWMGSSLLQPARVDQEEPSTSLAISENQEPPIPTMTGAPSDAVDATILPPTSSGPVRLRWLVGLGTGTDPAQLPAQEKVVADFNASQDRIELILEVVPYDVARDTLARQIASGAGPDLIGPVGWGGSNAFYGEWLDLAPYIEAQAFDASVFNPALIEFYRTEEGQVGLPFLVFPAAVYYVPSMFNAAGLEYPPDAYGEKYVLDGQRVDWDWETLAEVAKRLTVDANGNNATEASFDRTRLVQVGFVPQWQTHVNYQANYLVGGADIVAGDNSGSFRSTMPTGWREAMRWIHDAMYGDEPFMPTGPLTAAPEFGNGNAFDSGNAAMALTPLWYTCCLDAFRSAGFTFDAGILPVGADGQPHGRVDADTIRIWKGTPHPHEAFAALSYLIGPEGIQTLIIGTAETPAAYSGLPANSNFQQAYLDGLRRRYPFTTTLTWDVFVAGLSYPDHPSGEQWQPNWSEAWARQQTFFDMLMNTPQVNIDNEWQNLVNDLNVIYNR